MCLVGKNKKFTVTSSHLVRSKRRNCGLAQDIFSIQRLYTATFDDMQHTPNFKEDCVSKCLYINEAVAYKKRLKVASL